MDKFWEIAVENIHTEYRAREFRVMICCLSRQVISNGQSAATDLAPLCGRHPWMEAREPLFVVAYTSEGADTWAQGHRHTEQTQGADRHTQKSKGARVIDTERHGQ